MESTGSGQTDAGPVPPRELADAGATRALGAELAERLSAAPSPTLLLIGDLGAGKTCLVQGLAAALGIDEPITSPTFALAQHYAGRGGALVHLDLYRLEESAAADELFSQEEEEARASCAILAVEWPERLSFTPAGAWAVTLRHLRDGGPGRLAWLAPPAAPAVAGPPQS
ncbi:MAG: tRNA (adenosine(37)-N6)-threonylcarbamoyltransferase complex ATPase subunit type 1 TsaE [Cyanobacteriota bacterium]